MISDTKKKDNYIDIYETDDKLSTNNISLAIAKGTSLAYNRRELYRFKIK